MDKSGCELPMDWARRQFGACALGDKRRTNRVVKLGAMMARNSGGSLPAQVGSMAALKAAYRLLAEPDVTHWGLCSPSLGGDASPCTHSGLGSGAIYPRRY